MAKFITVDELIIQMFKEPMIKVTEVHNSPVIVPRERDSLTGLLNQAERPGRMILQIIDAATDFMYRSYFPKVGPIVQFQKIIHTIELQHPNAGFAFRWEELKMLLGPEVLDPGQPFTLSVTEGHPQDKNTWRHIQVFYGCRVDLIREADWPTLFEIDYPETMSMLMSDEAPRPNHHIPVVFEDWNTEETHEHNR